MPRTTAALVLLREARASATVEIALGTLSLTVVCGVLLGALSFGAARLSTHDAARLAARAAARGEPVGAVIAAATAARPGAQVAIDRDGDWVVVTVTTALSSAATPSAFSPLLDRLPALRATATARAENSAR